MSECACPTSGLGYRFHRYPCEYAGQIEELRPPKGDEA